MPDAAKEIRLMKVSGSTFTPRLRSRREREKLILQQLLTGLVIILLFLKSLTHISYLMYHY